MVLAFTPPSTLNASSADYEPFNCLLVLLSSIALLLTTIAWLFKLIEKKNKV